MKLRVMTIVGTRPELIRLSRVIAALEKYTDHALVHTGQNYDYELSEVFFEELGIAKPSFFLEAAGETAAETIGQIVIRIDPILAKWRPEAVLVLGDTNSCLAAIAAKRRQIPIFHMEAGNRCFDERVPEEINRRIIDHISDINLPYSALARENLVREGIPPDRIVKTGSPMLEVLNFYAPQIAASDIVTRLGLTGGSYFVVSVHREENVDAPARLALVADVLNGIAERFGQRVIVTTHPRTRKRLDASDVALREGVQLIRPLGFIDYVALQRSARVVVSDSGTITEEASILGLQALNLREAHERPEGMEKAAVMMTGLNAERVFQCLDVLLAGSKGHGCVADYEESDVSEKVVRIIHSYTDYVNRRVWFLGT